jgi:hypothetical protein
VESAAISFSPSIVAPQNFIKYRNFYSLNNHEGCQLAYCFSVISQCILNQFEQEFLKCALSINFISYLLVAICTGMGDTYVLAGSFLAQVRRCFITNKGTEIMYKR